MMSKLLRNCAIGAAAIAVLPYLAATFLFPLIDTQSILAILGHLSFPVESQFVILLLSMLSGMLGLFFAIHVCGQPSTDGVPTEHFDAWYAAPIGIILSGIFCVIPLAQLGNPGLISPAADEPVIMLRLTGAVIFTATVIVALISASVLVYIPCAIFATRQFGKRHQLSRKGKPVGRIFAARLMSKTSRPALEKTLTVYGLLVGALSSAFLLIAIFSIILGFLREMLIEGLAFTAILGDYRFIAISTILTLLVISSLYWNCINFKQASAGWSARRFVPPIFYAFSVFATIAFIFVQLPELELTETVYGAKSNYIKWLVILIVISTLISVMMVLVASEPPAPQSPIDQTEDDNDSADCPATDDEPASVVIVSDSPKTATGPAPFVVGLDGTADAKPEFHDTHGNLERPKPEIEGAPDMLDAEILVLSMLSGSDNILSTPKLHELGRLLEISGAALVKAQREHEAVVVAFNALLTSHLPGGVSLHKD